MNQMGLSTPCDEFLEMISLLLGVKIVRDETNGP